MKLVCPKCMTRLKAPADKIPLIGGWAKCPKCSERFFVQPPGKGVDLHSEASKDSGAGKRPIRDSASQRLIDRLKSLRGESQDTLGHGPLIYSEVTIFPEPVISPAIYRTFGLALLSLPLLFLIMAFMVKSEPAATPDLEIEKFKASLNDDKNIKLIQSDLVTIRRNMSKRPIVNSTVTQTGSESRVFNFFSERLAPGICKSITRLEITSNQPIKGFEATGVCSEGASRRLKMLVTWTDKTAVVKIQGYPEHEEMELYPIRPIVAKKRSQ